MSKLDNTIRLAFSAVMIAGLALPHSVMAQGKGKDKDKRAEKAEKSEVKREGKRDDDEDRNKDDDKNRDGEHEGNRKARTGPVTVVQPITDARTERRIPPGQAKKHVTTTQGVLVTRQVLLANGYQIVNVVPSGTSQIIYYRRGNNGVGRGLGPVERIVVVPSGQVVQFQSVPQSLLATILSRLGM